MKPDNGHTRFARRAPRLASPLLSALAACLVLAAGAMPAAAQAPAPAPAPAAVKHVTLVVPVPPGGSIDLTGRLLQDKLPELLQQPVVVDNKPGASGTIAAASVAKSPPDGTSVLLAFDTHATNGIAFRNLPYDTWRDLAPVIQIVSFPLVFAVPATLAANTLREFVDEARSRPGRWNYATAGKGTLNHLGVELFKAQTGIDLVHVPYKGGAPALLGLLAGDVQLFLGSYVAVAPHIKSGKAKVLAVASERRYAIAPELPTAPDAGFPDFQVSTWIGAYVAAGTPATTIQRLNAAIKTAVLLPDVREKLTHAGLEIVAGSPEELGAFARREHDKWAAVVRRAAISFD